jgi:hypothetical protein
MNTSLLKRGLLAAKVSISYSTEAYHDRLAPRVQKLHKHCETEHNSMENYYVSPS